MGRPATGERRSRPRRGGGRRLGGHVIAVAGSLFERHGAADTGMRDIASALGVAPSLLYTYAPSKQRLLAEYLSSRFGARNRALRGTILEGSDDDPVAQLRSIVDYLARFNQANSALILLAETEADRLAPELAAIAQARRAEAHELYADVLRRGRATGAFPVPEDPRVIAEAIKGMLVVLALWTHPWNASSRLAAVPAIAAALADDAVAIATGPQRATDLAADIDLPPWPLPEGTPGRIEAAGRLLFGRDGYDATSLRDLAAAAGLRQPSLYRHVSSKEELLTRIVERDWGHRIAVLRRALERVGDEPAARLEAMVRVLVHVGEAVADRTVVGGAEIHRFPASVHAAVAGPREELRRLLLGVLDDGRTTGRFAFVGDPERALVSLSGIAANFGFLRRAEADIDAAIIRAAAVAFARRIVRAAD